MNYHLYKGTAWTGPYSTEQIRSMIGNGSATIDDYVCGVGTQDAIQIKDVFELLPRPPTIPRKPMASPKAPAKKTETFKDHQTSIKNSLDQLVAAGKDDSKKGWKSCLPLVVIGFVILWGIGTITEHANTSGSLKKIENGVMTAEVSVSYFNQETMVDDTMKQIYRLAKLRPDAKSLQLTVHVSYENHYGEKLKKDVQITISDLDDIRRYVTETDYTIASIEKIPIAVEFTTSGLK